MDMLCDWLAQNLPASGSPTVVHNDYKLDNLMYASDGSCRVETILDWEMTSLGDPLADVGYFVSTWLEQGDAPVFHAFGLAPTAVPEAPTRQQLRDWYVDATGRDLTHIRWYEAFSYFRLAVIIAQIYARYHRGQTTDPRFKDYIMVIPPLAEAGQRRAETG